MRKMELALLIHRHKHDHTGPAIHIPSSYKPKVVHHPQLKIDIDKFLAVPGANITKNLAISILIW